MKPRERLAVGRAEMLAPGLPAVLRLPRQRNAVPGRVVEPDDRAGRARRPLPGSRCLVDDDDLAAGTGELERDGAADDTRSDDDRIRLNPAPHMLSVTFVAHLPPFIDNFRRTQRVGGVSPAAGSRRRCARRPWL